MDDLSEAIEGECPLWVTIPIFLIHEISLAIVSICFHYHCRTLLIFNVRILTIHVYHIVVIAIIFPIFPFTTFHIISTLWSLRIPPILGEQK